MTIQIPNTGTGVPADQTGDSPWLAMTKVAANFSNQTHAASRLVGRVAGNVMEVGAFGIGSDYRQSIANAVRDLPSEELKKTQILNFGDMPSLGYGSGLGWYATRHYCIIGADTVDRIFVSIATDTQTTLPNTPERAAGIKYGEIPIIGITATRDPNGFLKGASPIAEIYSDRMDLNQDAEKQGVTFEKVGTGNYLVKGSLGFAQDGWYIETPKDANGNVLVAVVYEQLANNDISIKTHAKKFDDETGDIVPNLLKPRDIPVGRFISLRLHELPKEPPVMPTETQPEI
ncbi:hypothetical phage protein [Psychrobacter phage Psymv2]|uniref:tail fiber protein n=1 Tax=Psychrobacter phage Psymv2 TaxID=1071177 RepID=UPI00022A3807|nr:tail fiber protein [Psychrobacter phage Psymv2]AEO01021.1 hypothetical phage protein [Psychrobacter phage Psymv2]